MGIFLVYMIKSSILLSLFYLLNRVLLEKETFHRLNRVLWILIIPLSYILTFVDFRKDGIDSSIIGEFRIARVVDPGVISYESPQIASVIATILVSLLVLVSVTLTIIWVINIIKLKKDLSHSSLSYDSLLDECKRIAGVNRRVNLYLAKSPVAPSSWMNNIIISETDIKENGREILLHELSHIRHGHSWDILIADVLIIVQWFNPASWLLKRAIRQVHEYQADDEVIKSGINAKQYQLLLIEKAVGKGLYSMANSFNHSKLKNRITMMLKEKSNKWSYAKCFYMIPLAFVAVSLFAVPEVSAKMEEISNLEITRFVSNTPQKTENILLNEQDPPIYIVDGKEVKSISNISAEAIESLNVWKDDQAVAKYGERGKNGVIEISLKEEGTYNAESGNNIVVRSTNEGITTGDSDVTVSSVVVVGYADRSSRYDTTVGSVVVVGYADRSSRYDTVQVSEAFRVISSEDGRIIVRGTGTTSSLVGEDQDILYIVDGKEVSEISTISPNDIESVSVFKDQTAVQLYGDKAQGGVIIITLKK